MSIEKPNPDRKAVKDRFDENHAPENPDVHRNFGDATPEGHGGVWCSYDKNRGEFEVYSTMPSAEYGLPETEIENPGDQYVEHGYVDFDDLVAENGEWKDEVQSYIDTFHRSPETPMAAVVNNRFMALAAWYAEQYTSRPCRTHNDHMQGRVIKENYDAVLDKFGINPEN